MVNSDPEYTIRSLNPPDIETVLSLLCDHADTRLNFADLLRYCIEQHWDAFVACDRLEIIGIVAGHNVGSEASIDMLCVGKEHRRKGLAWRLLSEFLNSRNAVSLVFLDVRVSNDIAQRAYESWGFTKIGRKNAYYTNEDAYTMSMDLSSITRTPT